MRLSRRAFRELVRQALYDLPEKVAAWLSNMVIVVQDWPTHQQMGEQDLSHPTELLGLYEGVPLTQREGYNMALPDRIILFQRAIEAACRTRAELLREVRITVAHELAHHFGIDDQRLEELGL